MFEGKRFFPDTGIPMRKIACINRLFALADPVPFTLASFTEKSFTRTVVSSDVSIAIVQTHFHSRALGRPDRNMHDGGTRRVGNLQLELLHVPGRRGAALRAEPAVHAHVLVLHHYSPRLGQGSRDVQCLVEVERGGREALAKVGLFTVGRDSQALDG